MECFLGICFICFICFFLASVVPLFVDVYKCFFSSSPKMHTKHIQNIFVFHFVVCSLLSFCFCHFNSFHIHKHTHTHTLHILLCLSYFSNGLGFFPYLFFNASAFLQHTKLAVPRRNKVYRLWK